MNRWGDQLILQARLAGFFILLILTASCSPAAQSTPAPAVQQPLEPVLTVEVEVEVEKEVVTTSIAEPAEPIPPPSASEIKPLPTASPIAQATLLPSLPPSLTVSEIKPLEEKHIVQVEWPDLMRLGDSDVIRMALIPAEESYSLVTEFPEHTTITQTIPIDRLSGYDLFAVARLDSVGFEISPTGEQIQYMPPSQPLTWRWTLSPRTAGQQRLAIILILRWIPASRAEDTLREVIVYSKALNIQVVTFLGLTKNQALTSGFVGLLVGSGFSLAALFLLPSKRKIKLRALKPNNQLAIELPARLTLSVQERALLQCLFSQYSRLVIEQEFLSGYSGARAFLARPIRRDGRTDAYTIAKLGEKESIRGEFINYENFVKDTLPPITARIQHTPVTSTNPLIAGNVRLAALQYTFIGAPGSTPTSLHQALLDNPDPRLLKELFKTFGPGWWLQRHPYTFRVAQEYDRLLPTHMVLEPAPRKHPSKVLDLRTVPAEIEIEPDDIVSLRGIMHSERRLDGLSLSLAGNPPPGYPPLRVRWLSLQRPEGAVGHVIATRNSLLRNLIQGYGLYGLPDPIDRLPALLAESISGSQSTIHGDLNLENILVGPGDMLWLIDFAQTRNGHPLQDFAHLYSEIVAHIVAPQISDPEGYLTALREPQPSENSPLFLLLAAVEEIAARCLFNPSQLREWRLSLGITCLGALKYSNLSPHARQLLFLTSAFQFS